MGKIRVKIIGTGEQEEQEKKKAKEKREAKKMSKAPGLKGGQRVVAVGPSEEELSRLSDVSSQSSDSSQSVNQSTDKQKTGKQKSDNRKQKTDSKKRRSKRYQTSAQVLDKTKVYPMTEALELLAKFQKAKFDETVELHLNTTRTGILGSLILPHGTGKTTKVAIADDQLIAEIETGKIDFDILFAKPEMMPKLARVAKILGPRGLMPNPKNGTITQNPHDLRKKYERGQVSFKTEAKSPLIHLSVGKFSFGDKKLARNINAILQAVKPENIQKIVLKSTMSPGIKIRV